MQKELLKQFHKDTWLESCIDLLEEEFFNSNKEIAFEGDGNFDFVGREECPQGAYRAKIVAPQELTLIERIMIEKKYREDRMKLSPANETEKIYFETTLEDSRQVEKKLLEKMERRNNSVGDIDKAKQYPIEDIIEFKHGFAKCLWHNDSAPSLHFIKERNTAHCFSCCKSFDSINAAQKVWGLSFTEAVKKLN